MSDKVRPGRTPCYKCDTREEGCHSTCERYKEWKALVATVKERKVDTYFEYNGYACERAIKSGKAKER